MLVKKAKKGTSIMSFESCSVTAAGYPWRAYSGESSDPYHLWDEDGFGASSTVTNSKTCFLLATQV